MTNSVWAAEPLPGFPRLERDVKTDVLIIGGGLAGLLCAYKLAKAGVDYALIEADRICRGISRNTTAKLTSQHGLIYDKLIREFDTDTARLYWEANEDALEQYRQLCEGLPCDFETKNAYVYTVRKPDRLERELTALKKLGVHVGFSDQLPLPFPVTGAIRFKHQAQFHPLKLAAGIAEGLNIYEHTAAREFVDGGVLTDRGKIKASAIIVASHFPILNKHGAYFLKTYQHRSYVLALENAPDVNGMYIDEDSKGLSFRNYGRMLLLGGGSHRTGKQGGGWAELEAFARKHYPQAKGSLRWAAQDCMTLDGVPYIGRYSKGTTGLYVASGFNKWGMTSSMVAATLLTDMAQGKKNPYAAVFSPSRRALRPQLLVNAFEAAASLLTPSTPRCPHMGCALKWNPDERSWDCPCHGSRFSKDGRLLDNPSTGNLKRR